MADAVDTFRRISWLIVKWILLSILALIALIAAIAGAYAAYQWYTQTRHEEKVQFSVITDGTVCKDEKYPIFISVTNYSQRTIEKVSVTLKANKPGYSSNLVRWHSYTDDKIIKPKQGYGTCWAVPELSEKVSDPRALEWGILSKTITFGD